jgi:hypothetical protein
LGSPARPGPDSRLFWDWINAIVGLGRRIVFDLAKLLVYVFWGGTSVVLFATVLVMMRRRLYREFPFFLGYAGFVLLTSVAGMLAANSALFRSSLAYRVIFSSNLAGALILRFSVIYEIVGHVLRPYAAIASFARVLFRWALALLLLLGVILAAYSPGDPRYPLENSLWIFERSASLMQIGLLILLMLFSSYLHLSWRDRVFGIALGLGIYASIELALSSVYVQMWTQMTNEWRTRVLDLIDTGTYTSCALIWLTYVWTPERKPVLAEHFPPNQLSEWNAVLERLTR